MWKKFYVVLSLLFLASLPLFSESETEVLETEIETEWTVPELEPEAIYEIQGQDLITLYTTINDLNETRTEYENLTNGMMKTLKDAQALCHEYAEENDKLVLENGFLIGTTVFSIGVSVSGLIIWLCTK